MQPDLPWNVAGIPPEAREAARAAARREGLSVGEWLTRRILRSFSDSEDDGERNWHRATMLDMEASMTASASSRDTDDMLARVSRTESEAKDVYRRIEDQLRNVARRLDSTERSQSENNRAMTKAATEINVATREQAQAFEQLASHVVKLTDRLSRVEHQATNDPIRDAVKGLHQGLSRLADQISETAHQSANQIESLAHSIESVAAKLAEAERVTHALEEKLQGRMTGLEDKVQSRAAELDERVRPVEKANEILDRLTTRFATSEAETSGAMVRLEDAVHKLQQDSATTAAMDKRLQGIEHALADIAGRLGAAERNTLQSGKIEDGLHNLAQQIETSEKRQRESVAELRNALEDTAARIDGAERNSSASGRIEDGLHNLAQQIEASEKRHREGVAELRNSLKDTTARIDALDGTAMQAMPMPQPAMAMAGGGVHAVPASFDLPPFPENMPPQASPFPGATPGGSFDLPPPPYDMAPAPGTENMYSPPPYFGGGELQQSQPANPATAESYIAAARRGARSPAAPEGRTARAPNAGFSWDAPQQAAVVPKPKASRSKFVLIAVIALIAAVAAVAGMMLSQGLRNAAPPTTQAVTVAPKPDASMPNSNLLPPAEPAASKPQPRHQAQSAPSAPRLTAPPPAKPAPSPMERLAALANAGNARAQTALGIKYLDGDGMSANEAEAARWLERAALQGEAVAAYRLGTLYERGHGVPADKDKAVHWYTVAANAGNRKAMHNLAVAYADGSGVKKDMAAAANWFTKAAALGLADSQFNLAVLYERGMGVPQSLINAYKWYAVAAAQGDSESKARIDALSTQLSPADRDTAQRAAASFKPMPMDRAANTAPDASEFAGG